MHYPPFQLHPHVAAAGIPTQGAPIKSADLDAPCNISVNANVLANQLGEKEKSLMVWDMP